MKFSLDKDTQFVNKWMDFASYTVSYRRVCIMITAEKIGLFRHLSTIGSASVKELSKELNVDEKGLQLLIECLQALGFVNKMEESFSLADQWADLLTEGSSMSLNSELQSADSAVREWLGLADILLGHKNVSEEYSQSLFKGQCHKYLALQAYNRVQAYPIIVKLLSLFESANEILDLAGADGYIADAVLSQTSNPNITIVDLEDANNKCSEMFQEHVNSGRLTLISKDIRELDLIKTFDIVMLTEVTELFDFSEKKRVIENAIRHLNKDGVMIITKITSDAELNSEALALFSLKMYLKSKGSYLETDLELSLILNDLGIDFNSFKSDDKTVFVCRKRVLN